MQKPGAVEYPPLLNSVSVHLGRAWDMHSNVARCQVNLCSYHVPILDPSIAMFGFASIATWPLTICMLRLVNA
jgi:hypothetical protein